MSFLVISAAEEKPAVPEPSLIERLQKAKLDQVPFTLVVEVSIKPESVKQFEELMTNAAINTHKEAGCLMYDYHRDPEAGPGKYVILERFQGVKALEEHLAFDYTKKLLAAFGDLSNAPPKIKILQQISPVRPGGNR